uniref:Uncharacterized protein n=1 Tax=Pinguiococcus pyrenoidosus TaxID=172671 RepID=A0A7R9UFB0_9STRA|mmetsp:Transcript_8707/g.32809  ORF Transcript_8707/g.32809 Transcript_8707/m.32809 type:complete len:576 (+) Transcript_8707:94-1821(+)|eukprot:scaffold343_cov245-Pinguiococcus_pyrenoidosus.AAC.24
MEESKAQPKRRTVGVIGAGISGLVTAKELKDVGVECEVFEMMPMLGGAFAHYGWKEGKLTSSSSFTWFSDFPMENRQEFLSWPRWLDYLQRYVDHNGIQDAFHFNCKVLSVEKSSAGGWDFTVHRKNWSNGAWQHPSQVDVTEEVFTKHFDVVVAGTGLHNLPNMPDFPGVDSFKKAGGEVIHSSDFQDASAFKSKRVLVVGAGESAADITWLTSQHASHVGVSMRSPPGTMFPHWIKGYSADVRDNRLIYSLPRATWPLVLFAHRNFYYNVAKDKAEAERADEFRLAADMNYGAQNCIFTINACKSFGIVKAVTRNGATMHTGIENIQGRTVYFTDGTKYEDCDSIIAATGFRAKIPAISDQNIANFFTDPRSLWKNMVCPEVDDFFAIGFCRPHQINLITCCEMQARAAAQIIAGNKALPPKEQMYDEIEAWKAHMGATFSRGYRALVDFIPFIDGIAEYIGCAPNLAYYMVTDPLMWVHMTFAPIQPSQYRLSGPGASYAQARATIMKSPYYKDVGNRLFRDAMVVLIALWAAIMGLLGFQKWNLVGKMRQPFQIAACALVAASLYALAVAA